MSNDRRTDGRTENWTPISHPATSRCDKKCLSEELQMSMFSWSINKDIKNSVEIHVTLAY